MKMLRMRKPCLTMWEKCLDSPFYPDPGDHNRVCSGQRPILCPVLSEISSVVFVLSCREADEPTNRRKQKHNLLGESNGKQIINLYNLWRGYTEHSAESHTEPQIKPRTCLPWGKSADKWATVVSLKVHLLTAVRGTEGSLGMVFWLLFFSD